MTIANISDPSALTGATVRGNDGDNLGKVDSVYYDNDTDQPEWVAVKSGMFGNRVSLVPLSQGSWDGNALTVPFDKRMIQAAPHHDPDAALSPSDEDDLYRHYGVTTGHDDLPQESTVSDGRRDHAGDDEIEGRDTSGPTTDNAMTRSEERLEIGTEQRESGRARLRKHIVTENVSTTVPVSHEEVTLEREPITDANRGDAVSGGDLTEEEHEVTLTEQRAVTSKETVPVERVRLGTRTVTEEQRVDETVHKEVIDEVDVDRTVGGHDRPAENKN
jgi:uncharacterized protein (TIGR02271 family)